MMEVIIILNNMLRVGIYLRLSNEDRDKKNEDSDSESIKNQRNMLLDYINKHPLFVLVDEYLDEDLSGAGTYRPEFERLISDCEKRKLDVVLCKSQSRFSRDMEIIEKYINNKFLEWNIRFIGISDNADTLVLGNKKSRQINGLVNEWYLEDVSNNIRSAFQAKMRQGEFISPFTVFGYEIDKSDNNKLVVDLEASDIVRKIYDLYLQGLGFTGIVKYLNNNNVPSPSLYKYRKGIKLNIVSKKNRENIKWNIFAIKSILTNEIYLGHLIQGKRTTVSYKNHKIIKKDKNEWVRVLNTHEAIIDKEKFDKVQKIMRERTKSMKNSNVVHRFSGKVFCLECGCYMRKKNTKEHEYLVCSNNNECNNKNSMRYDKLMEIVLTTINKKIKEFNDFSIFEKEFNNEKVNKYNVKFDFLENKKNSLLNKNAKIDKYIKALYEDRVGGVITIEQFIKLINNYKREEEELKVRLKNIDEEIANCKKNYDVNLRELFNKYKQFKELNRVIVQEFIDKIYIGEVNNNLGIRNINIIWNFK